MRIVNHETLDFTGLSEWSYVQVAASVKSMREACTLFTTVPRFLTEKALEFKSRETGLGQLAANKTQVTGLEPVPPR